MLFAADPPTPAGEGAPALVGLMPIILIVGLFFIMTFMSSRSQRKQQAALLAGLKRNDKIVNSGGVVGVIESVKEKDDEVVLKGGLRITKASIVRVVPEETAKEQEK